MIAEMVNFYASMDEKLENQDLQNIGFAFSHDKIEFGTWITQPVTIGVFLRVIPISHDEKADSEWNKDTPENGIKRRVFIISIDQS